MRDRGGVRVWEAAQHAEQDFHSPGERNGAVVSDPGAERRAGNERPRVVYERTRTARAPWFHEIRMVDALAEQQDGALELQIIDAEGQSGRQNLDEELRAVLRLRCDKKPVLPYWPHFTLDPIQRAEGVRQGGAQFRHLWEVSPRTPDGKGLLPGLSCNPLIQALSRLPLGLQTEDRLAIKAPVLAEDILNLFPRRHNARYVPPGDQRTTSSRMHLGPTC